MSYHTRKPTPSPPPALSPAGATAGVKCAMLKKMDCEVPFCEICQVFLSKERALSSLNNSGYVIVIILNSKVNYVPPSTTMN